MPSSAAKRAQFEVATRLRTRACGSVGPSPEAETRRSVLATQPPERVTSARTIPSRRRLVAVSRSASCRVDGRGERTDSREVRTDSKELTDDAARALSSTGLSAAERCGRLRLLTSRKDGLVDDVRVAVQPVGMGCTGGVIFVAQGHQTRALPPLLVNSAGASLFLSKKPPLFHFYAESRSKTTSRCCCCGSRSDFGSWETPPKTTAVYSG